MPGERLDGLLRSVRASFRPDGERRRSTLSRVSSWLARVPPVGEVVRGKQLALDDGEADLCLAEPGDVDGQIHHQRVRPRVIEPCGSGPAAVGGAVASDPGHSPGGGTGLGAHDLPTPAPDRPRARPLAAAHRPSTCATPSAPPRRVRLHRQPASGRPRSQHAWPAKTVGAGGHPSNAPLACDRAEQVMGGALRDYPRFARQEAERTVSQPVPDLAQISAYPGGGGWGRGRRGGRPARGRHR